MADKNYKELAQENEDLKKKLDQYDKGLPKVEQKLKDLTEENDYLKEEIKEVKSKKGNAKEAPKKDLTPKEKGFTTMMDVKKFKDQAEKNAPKKNKK